MGGRGGSSGMGKGAVPSESSIKGGQAEYNGLPVKYDVNLENEASNHYSYITVGDKFFRLDAESQRSVLNHEVAHTISDDMILDNSGNQSFIRAFVQEKSVPVGSTAYNRGQRTYFEGLYGDIGATALVETTTRAITEYLNNPSSLRKRSQRAYDEVRKYMNRRKRR